MTISAYVKRRLGCGVEAAVDRAIGLVRETLQELRGDAAYQA